MTKENNLIAVLSPAALFSALPLVLHFIDLDIASGFIDVISRLFLIGICTPLLAISFLSLWMSPKRLKPTCQIIFAISAVTYVLAWLCLP